MSSEENVIREEYRLIREWNTITGETSTRLIPVDTQFTRSRTTSRESLRVNVETTLPPPIGDLSSLFYDMYMSTINATQRLETGLELPEQPQVWPYSGLLSQFSEELLERQLSVLEHQEPVYITLSNEQFDSIPRRLVSRVSLRQYDNCAICQSDYMLGEEILHCPCSHKFHVDCGRRWFTASSSKCPVCRQDLREQVSS